VGATAGQRFLRRRSAPRREARRSARWRGFELGIDAPPSPFARQRIQHRSAHARDRVGLERCSATRVVRPRRLHEGERADRFELLAVTVTVLLRKTRSQPFGQLLRREYALLLFGRERLDGLDFPGG
jgi:hypothetical protein